MIKSILFNLGLAFEGVLANKFRAILTALGIIFGVAAVIAMLAIGKGAKEAILQQMSLIGTNNITITARTAAEIKEEAQQSTDDASSTGSNDERQGTYTPGLDLEDVAAITAQVPTVSRISPEVIIETTILRGDKVRNGKCIGVTNAFFEINNLTLSEGRFFDPVSQERSAPVCIIGSRIARLLFAGDNPVGEMIKCGDNWLKVIGLIESQQTEGVELEELGIRDYNSDVYVPIKTALSRFQNRKKIDSDDLRGWGESRESFHQIDKMVVNVDQPDYLRNSAIIISRLLKRRHNDEVDFNIEIPELLLQQQQKTQDTFNFVLAIIAGISLLVGGIGIMNIMLASVLERIKEIGIRRSMGATQLDIILQFLLEAVIISLFGGIVGIILGIGASRIIASSAEIPTRVDFGALALSFIVAVSIGVIFGLLPAKKAAEQDPIKSLRSD